MTMLHSSYYIHHAAYNLHATTLCCAYKACARDDNMLRSAGACVMTSANHHSASKYHRHDTHHCCTLAQGARAVLGIAPLLPLASSFLPTPCHLPLSAYFYLNSSQPKHSWVCGCKIWQQEVLCGGPQRNPALASQSFANVIINAGVFQRMCTNTRVSWGIIRSGGTPDKTWPPPSNPSQS